MDGYKAGESERARVKKCLLSDPPPTMENEKDSTNAEYTAAAAAAAQERAQCTHPQTKY